MKKTKKLLLIILTIAMSITATFAFASCKDKQEDSSNPSSSYEEEDSSNSSSSYEEENTSTKKTLSLTMNIEGAGIISGEGKYEYNENLFINAITNKGYYFLGWYYGNDLLSTSAEYNCQMWDRDVTLEAKFTALPDDYDEDGMGGGSPGDILNKNYLLHVLTTTPNLGLVDVNDMGYAQKYSVKKKGGDNVKVLALTNSAKRFLGWFDQADNLIMANGVFEFAMPSFEYTLKAKWLCDCTEHNYDYISNYLGCPICGSYEKMETYIDNNGFEIVETSDNKKAVVSYSGNENMLAIPNDVKIIADFPMDSCQSLQMLIIPNSVTNISPYAFKNCDDLLIVCEAASQPKGWHNLWNGSNCTIVWGYKGYLETEVDGIAYKLTDGFATVTGATQNVSELTIPSNVTYMGINFPVTSIGASAFLNNADLTHVEIPGSITSIGNNAFKGCYRLVEIVNKSAKVSIKKGSTENGYLGAYALAVYNSADAFTNTKLSNDDGYIVYTNGNEKTLIGYTGVETTLTIPSYITKINQYAFYDCKGLTSIVIPDAVKSIGDFAFSNCNALARVYYEGTADDWKSIYTHSAVNAFTCYYYSESEPALSPTPTGYDKDYWHYVGDVATSWVHTHTEEIIKETKPTCNTTGLTEGKYCTVCAYILIKQEIISAEHKYIDGRCDVCGTATVELSYFDFTLLKNNTWQISAKKDVSIPSTMVIPSTYYNIPVTSIGKEAFYQCSSLTNVVIPDSITSIGEDAFWNCYKLKSVTIGNSVTSIGRSAFSVCFSLTSIKVDNDNAAYKDIDGNLYSKDGKTLIQYAIGKNATKFIIPNSVTSIGDYAFDGCSMTSITIPDSVTFIGDSAFTNCSSLTSITIPDSVTSIGKYAFEYCSNLTSVYITDIAAWCKISFGYSTANPLYYAENLYLNNELVTELIIPDSVTSIGDYAFYGCSSLTNVTIPDGVTTIGDCAFCHCSSLTSVTIPYSVKTIGSYAFWYCASLTSIKYRGTSSQWSAINKDYNWNYSTGSYTITYNYTGN